MVCRLRLCVTCDGWCEGLTSFNQTFLFLSTGNRDL